VGMLVDNAIVVLENIDRHRSMGKSPFDAAHDGASEVWGAVLASTVTTVAVFLPVIFMEEEAGQLFKDIAIAITFAIIISLVVSITVIPSAANQIYRRTKIGGKEWFAPVGRLGGALSSLILALSRASIRNWATRILTIGLLTAVSVFTVWALLPKAEYLPQGNRNLILNILIPPPGYSLDKFWDMGEKIWTQLDPYFREDYKDGIPRMENMFYVGADRISLFGVISSHETEARDMIPVLQGAANSFPGVFGVSIQAGLFQNRLGRGRTVDVNVSGQDMDEILSVARTLFGTIQGAIPGAQVRPVPSLENTYPEANFIPDRAAAMANGIPESELGRYVDVIMDGRKVGEYKPQQQKKMDLVLLRTDVSVKTPEDVGESLIVNGHGDLIRISDIARLEYSQGMTQVDHLERKRTIRLEVTPSMDIPLQEAMEIIQTQVVDKLKAGGALGNTEVGVGGNADKLSEALSSMTWNLILALIIVYLLMSALFENFLYPLIILFSVPLAAAGGFVGLTLVDRFIAPQGFDILTMLGFIILIGTVVNNAILIVHQSLNNARYNGFIGVDAVTESVRTRIRPIFMSAMTSLFGMLPLVLSTGPGSELYRGLGSVILGGLAVSTLFTLFVIPCLLAFFIRFEKPRDPEGEGAPAPGGVTLSGAAMAGLALLFFGAVLLGGAPQARAQSLDELMDTAVAGRDLVKQYENRALQQSQDVRRAQSGFYPRADLGYTANQIDESSLFENDSNSSLTGVVRYNLFSGFADRYGLASARDLEKVREYELATVTADVRMDVAVRYLDVFRAQSSLEVAVKEVELLEKRVAEARSRYEVGLSRKNEVLQIQVELANAEQAGKTAQASLDKGLNLLALAVGAPVQPGTFGFAEFAELPRVKELSDYLDKMMDSRSELAALALARQAAENQALAARASLYPSVDLSGSLSRYGDDHFLGADEGHEDEARVTLGVTVNLFDGFSKYAGMSKARLAAREVEYRIAELKRRFSTDLHNTWLDYQVAVENLAVAQAAISQAEENLRITDLGFREGVETATDVLDAVFFLSRARLNLISARTQVFLDWFQLRRMVEEI
ncbi:MAG: efflux RND transporter permease subunit, partial [Proteobacteria bacterium]|nr:efflux RND transporter permease subunit [Pseudomonadota bacterium]